MIIEKGDSQRVQCEMKKTLTLLAAIASFGCYSATDDLAYGTMLLQARLTEYEQRYEYCKLAAESNQVSEAVIAKLRALPQEAATGLGFYHFRAIRNCALTEYASLLETLSSLEMENKEANNPAVATQIDTIKTVLFTNSVIAQEREFTELSEKIRIELGAIEQFQTPFNLFDTFERAWMTKQ